MGVRHNKKRVKCMETGVVYESLAEAAMALNCSSQLLWRALNGRTETCRGYHWDYV